MRSSSSPYLAVSFTVLVAACAPVATPPATIQETAQPIGSTYVSIAKTPSEAIAAMEMHPGYTPGGVIREEIPANTGQWGITQDNTGRVWNSECGQ